MSDPSPTTSAAAAVGEKRIRDEDAAVTERRVQPRSSPPTSEPASSIRPAGAVLQPPQLHRHALESVFAFCAYRDFGVLPTVARDWQAAVLSMAPLRWALDISKFTNQRHRIIQICESSLRRHMCNMTAGYNSLELLPDLQSLLSERMPHLRELIASVPLQSPQLRLQLPPHLVTLELSFTAAANEWVDVSPLAPLNAAVEAVADLARLETLNLCVPAPLWAAGCSLAPLTRTHQLRNLTLRQDGWDAPPMTDTQVSELRALSQLESVTIKNMDSQLLRGILAPPHSLRWPKLSGFQDINEGTAQLLVVLPLTELRMSLDMPHCDFLAQLPRLTDLGVARGHHPDTERILQAVGGCVQLRSLAFKDSWDVNGLHFTGTQLGVCLARLERLEKLELWYPTAVTTLEFLGQGSLPRTLTALHLFFFSTQLPVSEVRHVLSLGALQTLQLIHVFDAPLGDAELRLFYPPTQSPRIPHLRHFQCTDNHPHEDEKDEEPENDDDHDEDED